MTEPLFDPEKCDVEDVPKLDFDFVQDCTIAEPPPPIYDCQPPSVPREPPPPGCPQFQDTSLNVDTFFKTCTIKETGFATSGTPNSLIDSTKGWVTNNWAGYYVNILAGAGLGTLPIKILSNLGTTLNFETTQTFTPNATTEYEILDRVAGGSFLVTQTDVDPCRFALDLELQIPFPEPPCPEFSVTGTINYGPDVSAASVALDVVQSYVSGADCTTPPACQVDLTLDLQIPSPPCPEFTGAVEIGTYHEACAIKDRGTATSGTNASLTDASLPAKNWTINEWANHYLRITSGTGQSTALIKIAGNTASTLTFTAVQPFTVNSTSDYEILDRAPAGELVVTKTGGDPCAFALDLALQLPIPEPVCPVFSAAGTVLLSDTYAAPSLAVEVTQQIISSASGDCAVPTPCVFDLTVDLKIPKQPCPTISGAISVHSAADYTGAVTITPTTPQNPNQACKFALDFDIGIPVPPCPDITGTVNLKSTGTPSAALKVTPSAPVVPGDPCAYAISLDLDIPTPCVPNIDVTAAIICDGTRTSPVFETAVTKSASGCDYTVDLNIELPPIRPCPNITGSLNLKKGDLAGTLFVAKTTPTTATAACGYSVDLELYIPEPCTTSISTTSSVQYGNSWDPALTLTATKAVSGCHYDIVMDLDLPPYPACPTFSGGVSVYETTQPTGSVNFTVTPPSQPGAACAYDVNVAVGYTKNKLEKGTVTCAWTVCEGGDPTCDITIRAPNASGVQYLDLDIRIPKPPS